MYDVTMLKPGSKWRHFKTGNIYTVVAVAKPATNGREFDGNSVIYQGQDGHITWNRLEKEFLDGRFEPVLAKESPAETVVEEVGRVILETREENARKSAVDALTAEQKDVLIRSIKKFYQDKPRVETQKSISEWIEETFGAAGSNARVVARANEEMAELIKAVTIRDDHPDIPEEIADVFIVLYRVATRMGVDVAEEVDKKMGKNRARSWELDGTGCGYHHKES